MRVHRHLCGCLYLSTKLDLWTVTLMSREVQLVILKQATIVSKCVSAFPHVYKFFFPNYWMTQLCQHSLSFENLLRNRLANISIAYIKIQQCLNIAFILQRSHIKFIQLLFADATLFGFMWSCAW